MKDNRKHYRIMPDLVYYHECTRGQREINTTVQDYLNTGIMGSNPAQGKDVHPHSSVYYCPV
jgi:hypothetical protein